MSLSQIVSHLRNYPLEETPYPEGYPEDLMFDDYPGQDYVVGLCEETIGDAMKILFSNKPKANKELAQMHIDLFKQILSERKKKLQTA